MSAPISLAREDLDDGESYQVRCRGDYVGRVTQMHDGRWIAGSLPDRHDSRDAAVVALLTAPTLI